MTTPATPNHALRTAPHVTAAASGHRLAATMQPPRRAPRSLSLGTFGYMKFLIVIVFLLSLEKSAFASREGILALSRFQLESAGIGSSGKIIVTGQQDAKSRIITLTISAFGKDYVVPKEKLLKLVELHPNGVRISYEKGYPDLGGRTIYIQLQMGFTSFTKKDALITLSEDGRIEVSEIQSKNETEDAAANP